MERLKIYAIDGKKKVYFFKTHIIGDGVCNYIKQIRINKRVHTLQLGMQQDTQMSPYRSQGKKRFMAPITQYQIKSSAILQESIEVKNVRIRENGASFAFLNVIIITFFIAFATPIKNIYLSFSLSIHRFYTYIFFSIFY